MIIQLNPDGSVTGIVGSLKDPMPIDLDTLGSYQTRRQGVLMELNGEWFADMFLIDSSVILGPYASRDEAIAAEIEFLSNRI